MVHKHLVVIMVEIMEMIRRNYEKFDYSFGNSIILNMNNVIKIIKIVNRWKKWFGEIECSCVLHTTSSGIMNGEK